MKDSYYETCAIPKPGTVKKQKQMNGYKDKAKRHCFYTGRPGAERHEIFRGNNRQISIDNKFQIDVCPEIHRELQDDLTPLAQERNKFWQEYYQMKYEYRLMLAGATPKQARITWINLIGRNYL